MLKTAPIALFVYNRATHTRATLEALRNCELAAQSELYIFADAPRNPDDPQLVGQVAEVRTLIREEQWCGQVHIVEQKRNLGLADSIVGGINSILETNDRIIVLEDDICVTRGFLKFMNEALELYKDNERVMHVSGYIYPYSKRIRVDEETLFVNINTCWGWATWKRAWSYYNPDVDFHLANWNTEAKKKKFDIEGHAGYYHQLEQNKQGIIKSWAVKWYGSWLYADGYSLLPVKSLVRNIGNDGTGIHSLSTGRFDMELTEYAAVRPIALCENTAVRKSIDRFYQSLYSLPFSLRMKKAIKSLITGKEA